MAATESGESTEPLVPLTERVLRRLGRPRRVWIVLWALVPLLSPLLFSTAVQAGGYPFETRQFLDLVATQVGVAYALVVLLWGVRELAVRATEVRNELIGRDSGSTPRGLFRAIESTTAPLALTLFPAIILSASGWTRYGPLPPLVALAPLVVYLVPIVTFVWVYVTILADLDRLGGQPLILDRFPQDRTLGLQRLGALASVGLVLVLLAAGPVLFVGSDEPATLAIALSIVGITIGLFLISMWRLHRQMAAAKSRFIDVATRLYQDAYEPVRRSTDVKTLEAQANALTAAQSLADRAQSVMTWPLDESTVRFIAVVVTGVVTSLVVRGLFAAVGG